MMTETTQTRREQTDPQVRVQADAGMKMLFHLSKQPLIDLINGLFQAGFSPESTDVVHGNTEFVNGDLSSQLMDCYLIVREAADVHRFHVEFQTHDDSSMIIRMFEYGFRVAKDNRWKENRKIVLKFPQQLVLYLERDDAIQEEIACVVQFPPYAPEHEWEYRVPVLKFWNLDHVNMSEQLYALLPFRVFTSRKRIAEILQDASLTEEERQELVYQEFSLVMLTVEEIQEQMIQLHALGKLQDEDLNSMGAVLVNLTHHLYKKYSSYYETFFEEVTEVVTNILNWEAIREAEQRASLAGMQQGMQQGKIAGRMEAMIEMILGLLQDLGTPDDELRAKIEQETDLHTLSQWVRWAGRAASLQEFEHKLEMTR